MMSKKKKESLVMGLILLFVGFFFLLDNLNLISDIDLWDIVFDYWPLILVFIGLKNILQHFMHKK